MRRVLRAYSPPIPKPISSGSTAPQLQNTWVERAPTRWHAISLAQPTRRVAAVKMWANVPGLMVEVRLTADQFDTGIGRRKELPWLTDNSIPAANPADLKTLWKLQNTSKCGTVARA